MFVNTVDGAPVWSGRAASFRDVVEALPPHLDPATVDWRDAVRRARVEGLSLERAPLRGCNLTGVDLRKATLTGGDLRLANLSDALLDESVLTAVDLTGARLDRASFRCASAADACLDGVSAVRACFDGANLARARVNKGDLSRTSFVGAQFVGGRLDRVFALGADFSRAQMGSCVLTNGDFTKCLFVDTLLFQADFSGSSVDHEALLRAGDLRAARVPARVLASRHTEADTGPRSADALRRDALARLQGFFAAEAVGGGDRVALVGLGFSVEAWVDARRDEGFWATFGRRSVLELIFEAARHDRGVHANLSALYLGQAAARRPAC